MQKPQQKQTLYQMAGTNWVEVVMVILFVGGILAQLIGFALGSPKVDLLSRHNVELVDY